MVEENTAESISAEFPFESKYIDVHGSKIHYVEQGEGDPVLFLHGNPTSSYLWRNIIPYGAQVGRAIAMDLIGMGKSDKPDIGYRFFDHAKYVDGFIEAMGLRNITLVIHDWGSALGFRYAMDHESNVKGIVFMEAIMRTFTWDEFPSDFKMGFRMFRTPGVGWVMLSAMNAFVTQVMPQAIVRDLTDEEKAHYREPFPTIGSRKPVRVWPLEIPIDGKPKDVHDEIERFSAKLQESELPKLLFTATPGGIINADGVAWAREHLKNLHVVGIGDGIHYIQEDNPHRIGSELVTWYREVVAAS